MQEEIYEIEFEFPQNYFEPIKKLVREADPLISSSNIVGSQSIYDLERYMTRNNEFYLNVLMDNNIFTRIVYLAKGNEIPNENKAQYQLCCAVMCFFILGRFNIEPNVALYERTSKNTHSQAIEDLYYFRVADNIHQIGYARLALGIANKFNDKELQNAKNRIDGNFRDTDESNFGKLLDDWKLKYLHLLKVVEISKNTLDDTDKVKVFLDWITQDCTTSQGTIIFALLFFSPRKSQLPTMIKKINSQDSTQLKDGLKNAAWDLTYITNFRKRSKNQPENMIWFFCSNDDLLKIITRSLYLKSNQKLDTALLNLINDYWGKKKGAKIYEYYQIMEEVISSDKEARIKHNRKIRLQIDKMIEELELNEMFDF